MGFQVARTLLGFTRPYPWAMPSLITLGVLFSLSEGVGVGLLIPFLSMLLQGDQGGETGLFVDLLMRYAAIFDQDRRLMFLGLTIIALIVTKSLIQFAYIYLAAWLRERINHNLRTELCNHLFNVGYAFIARSDQGQLLNTLHGETFRTGEGLACLSRLVSAACTVAVFMVILVLISWQMTVAVVLGGLLASLVVRALARRTQRVGYQAVASYEALSDRLMEILSGMRMIRIFGQEASEAERFAKVSLRARHVVQLSQVLVGVMIPFVEVLYLPAFLGAVAVAIYAQIALPTMIAFLVLVYRMLPPVKNLDSNRVNLARFAGSVSAVAELLRRDDKPYIRSGSVPFEGLTSEIRFDRVSFQYSGPNERPALRDVSIRVGKGQTVAIVGGSGAGKSTIANLLCRLYDPTAGRILIDGRPLTEFDIGSWRRKLAFAGQDAELISGTVRENIAFSRSEASDAEIEAVARRVAAYEFIQALPNGFETPIGPRGLRLSGGQRQRIGLARALLREPEVLILDEATNALDSLSETAIQQTLEHLAGQLTMVVIAHRLSTIRNADHVVVLEAGRVVEEGSPEDLARRDGLFADLLRRQMLALTG